MFFFFKKKTAYEMRISDWSSDVCSSDLDWLLHHSAHEAHRLSPTRRRRHRGYRLDRGAVHAAGDGRRRLHPGNADGDQLPHHRSDERHPGLPLLFLPAVAGRPRGGAPGPERHADRSEEHTSALQSLMRISYAVFCLKKKTNTKTLTN